jgi:hypothetical protein
VASKLGRPFQYSFLILPQASDTYVLRRPPDDKHCCPPRCADRLLVLALLLVVLAVPVELGFLFVATGPNHGSRCC